MPTVFQTLCQALGRVEVFLEEAALHLGSPGSASTKSDRGCKREFRVDWAFKSSQNDGGEGRRRQVVLQTPNPRKECQGHRMTISQ